MLTNQAQIYPSVYITDTKDNTVVSGSRPQGQVGAIGVLPIGSPYVPNYWSSWDYGLLSLDTARGGSLSNILPYHIVEKLSVSPEPVVTARVLNSTDKTYKVSVDGSNSAKTEVNIFGASNANDWGDTNIASGKGLEFIVMSMPDFPIDINVDVLEDDGGKPTYIKVSIYDKVRSSLIYTVSGSTKVDSKDDYGNNNYIGIKADKRYLSIKADSTKTYSTFTYSFANTTIKVGATPNYDHAIDTLKTVGSSLDYLISGSLSSVSAIQKLAALSKEKSIPLIIDVLAADGLVATAKAFKDSLTLNTKENIFLWSRIRSTHSDGVYQVGLSGWYAGKSISRNLNGKIGSAEDRMSYAIAGVNHPVPRSYTAISEVSAADKTTLTKERINTVDVMLGKNVISDVLSGDTKETHFKLFPVADSIQYIEREIGRIIVNKQFFNLGEARDYVNANVSRFLRDCSANRYFDSLAEEPYKFTVTTVNSDTVVVNYEVYPNGIARLGIVRGAISQRII